MTLLDRPLARKPARRAETDTGSGSDIAVLSLEEAASRSRAWQDLADRAIEPNPFYRPEFLVPFAGYLQAPDLRVLFIGPQDRPTGLIPLNRTRIGFGFSGSHEAGLYHSYGPVGTPLIARNSVTETLGSLFALAERNGMAGIVFTLDPNGPIAQTLWEVVRGNDLKPIPLGQFRRASLDATQTHQTYRSTGPTRKKRKEMRRLLRRLEDHGTVGFHAHTTCASIAPALERFIDLEKLGWKGRRETALGSTSARLAATLESIGTLARTGRVRIDEISAGSRTAASMISLIDGDRLFTWKIAYAEDLARYSPGSQIMLALTTDVLDDPAIRFADSLAGENHPMIDHLWRQRLTVARTFFPLRPLPELTTAMLRADHRIYDRVRRTAKNWRAFATARTRILFGPKHRDAVDGSS
ncbi:MAG: GNAT family N-acetyltransferase [Pseudomonadota bacterium]